MILLILIALVSVLALYIRHHYTFWQRNGFPVAGTNIPFGCMESVVKRQKSLGMAIYDVYKNSTERFLGIYLIFRRAILVRDAELARQILVQDFASFHDRGIYVDEENDPFSGQLFALKGERWKTLRTKLAPSFTSGKLKGMFATIDEVGDKMVQHLNKVIPEKGDATINMKEVMAKYAIDIIGSTIFGLEVDSFENPKNKFRTMSAQFNHPTFSSVVRSVTNFLCPVFETIFFRLGIKDEVSEYMKQLVRETVEFREKNNFTRKDMMQMLIQLRNTGKVNIDDNIWDVQSSADGFKSMSTECIAGQAFLFYVAGYETSASAASFTLYELARNPELLAKAQEDVKQALEKHDGKITYEAIQDMKFLELCFMESIRKYPGLPILNRECTKDFAIPNSDKVIKQGTPIVISLFGIQRDPEYFPDPLKFDPERFLESNQNYNPVAYMPFGEGPRHCIAQRLGKINVKVALAKILLNYDVEAVEKGEIEFENFAVTIVPKGGVNLKLKKKIK